MGFSVGEEGDAPTGVGEEGGGVDVAAVVDVLEDDAEGDGDGAGETDHFPGKTA